jgi:hypothetical protein
MLRVNAGNTNNLTLGWMVRTTSGPLTVSWSFASGQLSTWTHLAGTYDGANLRVFVNAVEVASVPHTGTLIDAGNTLRIGNGDLSAPGIEEWNGGIDEVRLWPFARTAAEIAATMQAELSSVPGETSTWNLNGDGQDSSGSNHGQLVNAPTFAPIALNLTAASMGGANFGTATAGCTGAPRAIMTTRARVGASAFAVGAVRSTSTGSGILWLGTRALPTAFRLFGVDLWIDPAAPNVQVAVPGGLLGYARVPLPIPNNAFLANRQLFVQTVWAEAGCATPLFASDGLVFLITP